MTTNSTFYVSRHDHVWAGGTIRTELISFKRSQTPVKIRWVDGAAGPHAVEARFDDLGWDLVTEMLGGIDPALDAYLLGLFTGRGVDVGSENIG